MGRGSRNDGTDGQHGAAVVWFTGLSGAGKSTIATALEARLRERGCRTAMLDGDAVRTGLNRDLGYGAADRAENVRRLAEVARLMADAGLVVLVPCISPFCGGREAARAIVGPARFAEVHVDVPLSVAECRDPKGLYRQARAGELPDFTGIDSPYEVPTAPQARIDTTTTSPARACDEILALLAAMGALTAPGPTARSSSR